MRISQHGPQGREGPVQLLKNPAKEDCLNRRDVNELNNGSGPSDAQRLKETM